MNLYWLLEAFPYTEFFPHNITKEKDTQMEHLSQFLKSKKCWKKGGIHISEFLTFVQNLE